HVGNWPGVTVDKKEGSYRKNRDVTILDLPGTYSLSPYSAEEIIARDYIVKERPDAVINIVDGTSIERNLYLTLQIMETRVPMVVAINMMDEVEAKGDSIDCAKLTKLLGVPVVPIVARSGKGLDELLKAATRVAESKELTSRPELFDTQVNETIEEVRKLLPMTTEEETYWKALKLVEADDVVFNDLEEELKTKIKSIIENSEKSKGIDLEAKIADLRYQYIAKLVKDSVKKSNIGHVETRSDKLDKLLTNRFLAIPVFAVIMYLLFACTFSENFLFIEGLPSPGIWLAGVAETGWGLITGLLEVVVADASPWVYSLVIDGIMGGVGAIIGFLPLVLVLFVLISILEDSGYMARVAFVMDRIFRRFGLSGRSFIPLLMGFGCGVPAITATRTLESEKDRKITTIITGFMPCGAKLPIFALFVSVIFADSNKTLVTYSLYMLSIVVAIIVSLLLNKFVYKSETSNFVMELPQYRIPTGKSVIIHVVEKLKDFAIKAGTIIFLSTILLWVLSNFNVDSFNGKNAANNEDGSVMSEMDDSFLAQGSSIIAPIFQPLGFGEWRPTVGIITGWIAKENVVVTFSQLYDEDVNPEYLEEFFSEYSTQELGDLGFTDGTYNVEEASTIYAEVILFEGADENALTTMKDDIPNKAAAYAYMVFNLLCMPCFAAVGAMKKELKTWRLTGFGIGVQMLTAYIVALLINQIGRLFVA
ncbi:MAG: ferrous iron transport protein, partial [Herbinix sp.]|nr:ferrous iron transport protein [Herbinix sp.]